MWGRATLPEKKISGALIRVGGPYIINDYQYLLLFHMVVKLRRTVMQTMHSLWITEKRQILLPREYVTGWTNTLKSQLVLKLSSLNSNQIGADSRPIRFDFSTMEVINVFDLSYGWCWIFYFFLPAKACLTSIHIILSFELVEKLFKYLSE